jgi:glyoxylase-like metal-dependent hydrolase (beta-lactamase superfamily II)
VISRQTVGNVVIHALRVAALERSVSQLAELFPAASAGELTEAIAPAESSTWTFTLLLLTIGRHTILVDTGFSFLEGGPGSGTSALLAEAGVSADAIDTVVVTHGHGDHIGGLLCEGAPAFPGARVIVARREYEFWMGTGGEEFYGIDGVAAFRSFASAYGNRVSLVDDGELLLEEAAGRLAARLAPGHTPGHLALELSSGDERFLVLADVVHAPFQLSRPDWSPKFDVDPALAEQTRRGILSRAADERRLVHLFHYPFPGIGRIGRSGASFVWEPAGG